MIMMMMSIVEYSVAASSRAFTVEKGECLSHASDSMTLVTLQSARTSSNLLEVLPGESNLPLARKIG